LRPALISPGWHLSYFKDIPSEQKIKQKNREKSEIPTKVVLSHRSGLCSSMRVAQMRSVPAEPEVSVNPAFDTRIEADLPAKCIAA